MKRDADAVKALWYEIQSEILTPDVSIPAKTSLSMSQPLSIVNGALVLGVPNEYCQREIETSLKNPIIASLQQRCEPDETADIAFVVLPAIEQNLNNMMDAHAVHQPTHEPAVQPVAQTAVQPSVKPEHNVHERYTFDNFVLGPSNEYPYAASIAVSQKLTKAFNPLFIYGYPGLGKTHLLNAIGNKILQDHANFSVCYIQTGNFINHYMKVVQSSGNMIEEYKDYNAILIDDIQGIENREGFQATFFSLFNEFYLNDKLIVMTSDRHPSKIAGLTERLRDRFQSGLQAEITLPTIETRIAILKLFLEQNEQSLGDNIIERIAERNARNIRSLEGCVTNLMAQSSLLGEPITMQFVDKFLDDFHPDTSKKQITQETIKRETAKFYSVTVQDLIGTKRTSNIAIARHVAVYLCRKLTDLSLKQIGEGFGNRDHTTMINSYNKIHQAMQDKSEIFQQIQQLTGIIQNQSD